MSDTAKAALIEQFKAARHAFVAVIDDLDPETVVYDETGWRVRDIVAHMAAWYGERVAVVRAYLQGESYSIPDFVMEDYNRRTIAERKAKPVGEVYAEWVRRHEELLGLLDQLPAGALADEVTYPWGAQGPLSTLLEKLIEHEWEHHADIEQVRQQS